MGSVHLMAAMLGSGRNQLSRSILRQVTAKNGRDARSLASLVNISAGKEIVKSGVTGVSKQPQVWESIYRGLRTTPALGNEIKEVVCPAFADSISEGDVRWEKQVGDSVAEADVLCEIETDKTSVPVPSPAAGVIEELLVEDGATVSPGTKLLKLNLLLHLHQLQLPLLLLLHHQLQQLLLLFLPRHLQSLQCQLHLRK